MQDLSIRLPYALFALPDQHGRIPGAQELEGGSLKIARLHVVHNTGTKNWETKKEGSTSPTGVFPTQKQAIEDAKQQLMGKGGEVVIHRPDGEIRDSDTVPPGPDPCPPRDTRH